MGSENWFLPDSATAEQDTCPALESALSSLGEKYWPLPCYRALLSTDLQPRQPARLSLRQTALANEMPTSLAVEAREESKATS